MKELVVEKENLKHNLKIINEIISKDKKKAKLIAVVKGNGYGLDLVKYTQFLIDNGVDFFAVATVEEAVALRNAGITQNILMMSSTAVKEDIEILIKNNIILTVGSKEAGEAVEEIAQKLQTKARAHLKIDTGFGRYGFVYTKKDDVLKTIKQNSNIEFEGIFTHFSIAFYDDKITKEQFEKFMNVVKFLEENNIKFKLKHACNSSAFVKFPEMHLDAVRVGSAFVGRLSVENKIGVKKIGTLESKVAEVRTLPANFNIGYSNIYLTKKETKVAIIPVGHSDGFNVSSNRDMFRKVDKLRYILNDIKGFFKEQYLKVNINNKNYKLAGRLGMYHSTVIVDNNVKVGDKAVYEVNPIYIDPRIRREYK